MMDVGIIGWRGMVGSVLLERMRAERDFDLVDPVFFSTSQAGGAAPDIGRKVRSTVQDANDLAALKRLPMLISTQGGDYTQAIHSRLRESGWQGYWIDAASTLRMADASVIVLDPVNLCGDGGGPRRRHQGFHRWQLHRLADAHGGVWTHASRVGRMDQRHDLSIGLGRGRAKHARASRANGRPAPLRRETPGGSGIGDSRHRSGGHAARSARRISRRRISARRWPRA